jgi:hypothetical protein
MSASSLTLFRASLLAALWLMSGAAIAGTTVYKWVDEKGVTHYSDQPNPKAQKVEVQGAQSYGGDTVSSSGPSTRPSESAPAYSRCELSRPAPEENFQNTSTITAQVRLEPALQPGHQVILTLDGKRLTNQSTYTTDFVITELVRGAHSLSAVVLNGGGQPVCTTPSVTFHVHLPSLQSPVRRPRR